MYEQNVNNMGVGVHIRTFLLDYPSMSVRQLKYPTILKGKLTASISSFDVITNLNLDEFKPAGITTFTLRNQVFLAAFQESMVELFEFDEIANESFVWKQKMSLKSYWLAASRAHISATALWK